MAPYVQESLKSVSNRIDRRKIEGAFLGSIVFLKKMFSNKNALKSEKHEYVGFLRRRKIFWTP